MPKPDFNFTPEEMEVVVDVRRVAVALGMALYATFHEVDNPPKIKRRWTALADEICFLAKQADDL
jgi:hypothetical protein